jgi:hypothetical protein
VRMRNELTIRGEPPEIAKLVERIESAKSDAWKRELEIEERLWRPPNSVPSTFCFKTPADPELPAAYLLLDKNTSRGIEVSNIMLVERKPLTDEQYNHILDRFNEEFLKSIVDDIDVDARILPFRVKLEKILSREGFKNFESFSKAADKASLSPTDRRKWSRFVTQVHIDGSALDPEELDWSLRESGWPEEQRQELLDRYKEGLSMLMEYDEARVG